ncbi:peptide/nickel transport system permease protein [Devosia subaequoris]|uniref:Peptide/nickel transport system permease protein n=1 Tax=Devosia subaequoris TaxID=395930 RepID=A0A7W6IRV3_9HYPH|nr:ABC transporter permease [Devosia subaequoris]MBB4053950.1 peptide/nickel transport system permease protein [Devosia subaequoris]MCP1211454.1 ABC transporter permease [Devosia subaequoris]
MAQASSSIASSPASAQLGTWGKIIRTLRREPGLVFGIALLAILLVMAVFPWLFTPHSPVGVYIERAMQAPSWDHWFGTDDVGRDVFTRVIYGARVTLAICAGSLLISAIVGGTLGLVSGFFGGWTDQVLGRAVDVLLSFPPIILGVIITGVLGPEITNLVLALSIVYMPVFFRIARAGAMSETGKTYVEAARSIGVHDGVVLSRHVTRNVLPLILTQYIILFPLILQIQAALGFLGLGVQPPTPDWGAIMEQGKDYTLYAPWISVFPGIAVLIAALALMLVGRGVQKRMDQR